MGHESLATVEAPESVSYPPSQLLFHIAQLRHGYRLLVEGRVSDRKMFADGIVAPAIRFLESQASGDRTVITKLS
jgi:hypothetical protein